MFMEENIPSLRKYTLESLGVRDQSSYNISSDILPKKNRCTYNPDWCGLVGWELASELKGHGTCPGCGPGPWLGACKRQLISDFSHISVSLHFSLPSLLSLKINL